MPRSSHNDLGDVELLVARRPINRSGDDVGSDDDPSEVLIIHNSKSRPATFLIDSSWQDAPLRSLLGCERKGKRVSLMERVADVMLCCCRIGPRLWSKKVVHLPRVVPLDCSPELRAALARARGATAYEGLAAALAVPNIVRNQKYSAATCVFQALPKPSQPISSRKAEGCERHPDSTATTDTHQWWPLLDAASCPEPPSGPHQCSHLTASKHRPLNFSIASKPFPFPMSRCCTSSSGTSSTSTSSSSPSPSSSQPSRSLFPLLRATQIFPDYLADSSFALVNLSSP